MASKVLAPPTTIGLEPAGLCFCSSFKSSVHHCVHVTPRSTKLTSAGHSPFICEASLCEKTSHQAKVHLEWGNEKAHTCSQTSGTLASCVGVTSKSPLRGSQWNNVHSCRTLILIMLRSVFVWTGSNLMQNSPAFLTIILVARDRLSWLTFQLCRQTPETVLFVSSQRALCPNE